MAAFTPSGASPTHPRAWRPLEALPRGDRHALNRAKPLRLLLHLQKPLISLQGSFKVSHSVSLLFLFLLHNPLLLLFLFLLQFPLQPCQTL